MSKSNRKVPELLAPAGTMEVFEAAVKAGADAVYIGTPSLNARALAKNFRWPEVAAMIDFAHNNNVKTYAAMNSLMREDEIPQAVEALALLEAFKIDGVILQDLGIYRLARKFFPQLRLHASTLLGAHNSLAVNQFSEMGFSRVVLARELTLHELKEIGRKTAAELEVFVHGALCFSYSGLCLFSSFLGGKSGLRGRCVQPCRRKYIWQGKGGKAGYLFSMNDLEAVGVVPKLIEAGIASFKIEGRMRSSQYVSSVVEAYRLLLDNPNDNHAGKEARRLLGNAMGRKTTTGYFLSSHPPEIITPHHSGNIGVFLGKAELKAGQKASLTIRSPLKIGDRVRVHHEKSGERTAFTLQKMWAGKKVLTEASENEYISLEVPVDVVVKDSFYKVDVQERKHGEKSRIKVNQAKYKNLYESVQQKKVLSILGRIDALVPVGMKNQPDKRIPFKKKGRRLGGKRGKPVSILQSDLLPLWVKIDDIRAARFLESSKFAGLIITLDEDTYRQFFRSRKILRSYKRNIKWSLPPVIDEGTLSFYGEAIRYLVEAGFNRWQIAHIGQRQFFKACKCEISGDYTLNMLNSQAVQAVYDMGVANSLALVETDKQNLFEMNGRKGKSKLGVLVYGRPPLFVARPDLEHFRYDQKFISPKGEKFILQKKWGKVHAYSENIFSLLPWLPDLKRSGVDYGVIDFSNSRLRSGYFDSLLRSVGKPLKKSYSSFNYNLTLS